MDVDNLNCRGFTLIELLVGLTILAILCYAYLPTTPSIYQKNHLQIVADEMKEAIHYARIQALLTGEPLLLMPIASQDDWSQGLILFVDNAQHQYTPESTLLHEWGWHATGIRVQWRGFQSNAYLRFSPDIASNAVNGFFIVSNSLQQSIKLVVNRFGRVKAVKLLNAAV